MTVILLGLLLFLQEPGVPALTGRVVDTADILSGAAEADLTARLERLERDTSVQIVVATVPTLAGAPIEDYAIRLAETWGIGQAATDNGIVVLIVPNDRAMRIEVGYGLESVIPDGLAGRIIRERMAPAFRANDYHGGIAAAIEGLELAARREYPEAPVETAPESDDGGAAIFAFFVLGMVANAFGIWLALIGGAIIFTWLGGPIAAALGWWAAPAGSLIGLLVFLLVRTSGKKGHWTSGGRSRSGGFSGGGFSGSSGGFSGGGGSFGGGGASGSW